MMQYGNLNPLFVGQQENTVYKKRKLLKVDHIVFDILLERYDSVYDNPVACIFGDKEEQLTKTQCGDIIRKYPNKATGDSNGKQYEDFGKYITGVMFYDAMNFAWPCSDKSLFSNVHCRNYLAPALEVSLTI